MTINHISHESGQIARILASLRGKGSGVRDSAIAELIGIDHSQAINELARFLIDPEPSQRALAAEALILLDAKRTLEFILPLLMDSDAEVRWMVCYLLTEYGNERAIEPLIRVLLEDPDVNVRTEAAVALGSSRDHRAIPALNEAWIHDFEVDRQGHIVSAVAKEALHDIGVE